MNEQMPKGPVVLAILDGWGLGHNGADNAIVQGETPHLDRIYAQYPWGSLVSCGEDVGLLPGQMGDSNVGHMNIGAGRVVYQRLSYLAKEMRTGGFNCNEVIANSMPTDSRSTWHLVGLLSDGGVHSHIDHIIELLRVAKEKGLTSVAVHAFLDGRDVAPSSAGMYLHALQTAMQRLGIGHIATISGRYYAMDRDKRWNRVRNAWEAMVLGCGQNAHVYHSTTPTFALAEAYARGETDEFVRPTVISIDGKPSRILDGDGVFFFNFRADRARQLSHAFVDEAFQGFARKRPKIRFATMTEYEQGLTDQVAFHEPELSNLLGDVLAQQGLRQLRLAETEKMAHVTFFFDGGSERDIPLCEKVLIPSPAVATYDLQPEMSAELITLALLQAIDEQRFDVAIVNFANGDMVGHTGDWQAALQAVACVDNCLGHVLEAVLEVNGTLLITSDHGNCDQMRTEEGQPHTAHTLSDVPFIVVSKDASYRVRNRGRLADIAPSILHLLNIAPPSEMTGESMVFTVVSAPEVKDVEKANLPTEDSALVMVDAAIVEEVEAQPCEEPSEVVVLLGTAEEPAGEEVAEESANDAIVAGQNHEEAKMGFATLTEQDVDYLRMITAPERVTLAVDLPSEYSKDEMTTEPHLPEVMVEALSAQEVSAVMNYASKHRLPVTPRGQGTGLAGGCVPLFGGILLNMSRMNNILELDEENLTLTVEPGVLLMEIAQFVEPKGLFYPPDPGEKTASIGGNISTNAGGMRAVKYGVTRDYIRGLQVVLPDGEIIEVGGKVVKSSSGYDLKNLLVGSEGTLGIITQATLKLLPKPSLLLSLLIPFEDLQKAIDLVPLIIQAKAIPVALEFLDRQTIIAAEQFLGRHFPDKTAPYYLLLSFDGNSQEELDSAAKQVADLALEHGAIDVLIAATDERRDSIWSTRSSFLMAIKSETDDLDECDVVVPRNRIADVVAYVLQLEKETGLTSRTYGHAGDGNLHIKCLREGRDMQEWEHLKEQFMSRLYDYVQLLEGHVSGEHGIGSEKRKYLHRSLNPRVLALMRAVKSVFDPLGILNPGKII